MATLAWLGAFQERGRRLGLYTGPVDSQYGPMSERMLDALFAQAEKAAGIQPPVYPHLERRYQFLNSLSPLPLIVHEALKTLGTVETAGAANSPVIMGWRDELRRRGVAVDGYSADSVPWCGLWAGYVAAMANKDVAAVGNVLWARNWLKFGVPVDQPALGDIAVWPRGSGGHVNMVIALDKDGFVHGIGGNQGDAVNIMRKHRDQALGFRRPVYRNQPATVKQYVVDAAGKISEREA